MRYALGGRPGGFAVGGGTAWVIAPDDGWGVLWRINVATGGAERLEPTRGSSWPTFGEGYAWAPCAGTTDNPCGGPLILKIDARTGAVLARIEVGSTGFLLAVAAGGLWVPGESGLALIDPSTDRVQQLGGRGFSWIGGSHSSLWAASDRRITQLDPNDGSVLRSFSFDDPCFLNVTSEAVWAQTCRPVPGADRSRAYSLIRIDTASGEVRQVPIAGPTTMVSAAGRVWLVRYETSGGSAAAAIESIDALSMRPVGDRLWVPLAPERWGGPGSIARPTIFAVADGETLWLSNTGEGDLIRVGLPA